MANITEPIPNVMTIQEDDDSLKIIENPAPDRGTIYRAFIVILINVLPALLALYVLYCTNILKSRPAPCFAPSLIIIICAFTCYQVLPMFINKMIIEINREKLSIYYKPLPRPSPILKDIPLSDINDVFYELEDEYKIYPLKLVLKNGEKVEIMYLEKEQEAVYFQSVIKKRLNLKEIEEKEIITGKKE